MINTPPQDTEDEPAPELEMLIELLLDDALTEDQVAQLGAIMANDPEAKTKVREAQRLHADLLGLFTTLPETPLPFTATQSTGTQ